MQLQIPSADGKQLSLSWWGGDSRHEATLAAIDKFMELNPDIEVKATYGAWDGWEEKWQPDLQLVQVLM